MPKANITDHGQILAVNCPECKKNTPYKLVQKTFAAPMLLKIFFAKDTHFWHVECCECRHSVKVPNHEAEKLPEVKDLAEKMAAGEITSEEFHQVFGQFSFIAELLNQTHAWNCPACAEKVEWQLQVCWNCATPNPEIQSDNIKVEMPKFVPPACGFNVIQQ